MEDVRVEPVPGAASHAEEFHVDGVRLCYRAAGPDHAVPLVFLHGGPGQGSQLFQLAAGPELEKTHRVIYLDQRGSGRSDRPADEASYSLAILVEDIEHLRRHLGAASITLLGHSFGTQLALEYAARFPKHTNALVLAGATSKLARTAELECGPIDEADWEDFRRSTDGVLVPFVERHVADGGTRARALNGPSEPVVDQAPGFSEAAGEAASAATSFETSAATDALFSSGLLGHRFADFGKVSAPTLVIAGGEDLYAPLDQQHELVRSLVAGRLILYPDSGHLMFVDSAERFARDVAAFLQSVDAARR